MSSVSSSGIADKRNHIRVYQVDSNNQVPRNLRPELTKEQYFGIGTQTAAGYWLQCNWRMKHKLLQVMEERKDCQPTAAGYIQMNNAYWGGEQRSGGKRGSSATGEPLFVAAVQTNEEGHPIAMRFTRVKGFSKEEIS